MLVLFSRNFPQIEDRSNVIWPVLDEGGLDIIFTAYSRVQPKAEQGIEDESEYNFAKRLVQVRSYRAGDILIVVASEELYIRFMVNKVLEIHPDAEVNASLRTVQFHLTIRLSSISE